MSDFSDGFEIGNVESGVANCFDINGLGAVVDGGGEVLRLVALDELGRDAQPRKEDLKLVVGTSVQVAGSDNVIAGMGQGRDGHELGSLTGGSGNSGDTALEGSNTLFEDIYRRLEASNSPRQLSGKDLSIDGAYHVRS